MDHKHKVEFPQIETIKQHVRAELRRNRKLYIGFGVGFAIGVFIARRPYVVVLVDV